MLNATVIEIITETTWSNRYVKSWKMSIPQRKRRAVSAADLVLFQAGAIDEIKTKEVLNYD